MGPRGRNKVNVVLILGFEELGSGNGEAGPVTLVQLQVNIQQCVVSVVVRGHRDVSSHCEMSL